MPWPVGHRALSRHGHSEGVHLADPPFALTDAPARLGFRSSSRLSTSLSSPGISFWDEASSILAFSEAIS